MNGELQLLRQAPVALCAISLQGVILEHNTVFAHWSGESDPDANRALVGQNLIDWLTPAGRLLYETRLFPALLEHGTIREAIIEVCTRSGRRTSMLFNARIAAEADGERRIYLAIIDAEARLGFERELVEARRLAERARAQLLLLQEATSQLAVASGLEQLGETLVDVAGRAVQAAWTLVRFAAPAAGANAAAGTASPVMLGSAPGAGSAVPAQGVGNEMLICRSPEEILAAVPEHATTWLSAGVESLVATPIVSGSGAEATVFGVIYTWFRRSRTLESDALETLQALAAQAERVLEHVALQERVRHRALHDGLTGLPNRHYFEERVQQCLRGAHRTGASCGVIFLDLDGFKPINDLLGHGTGDAVLSEVARRLQECCRGGETVARLGGDEFVIAVESIDDRGLARLASRVSERLRAPLEGVAAGFPLSASIGAILCRPVAGMLPQAGELIADADAAMYAAKQQGKDQIVIREWAPARR